MTYQGKGKDCRKMISQYLSQQLVGNIYGQRLYNDMYCAIISSIVTLLILYALTAYLRRKLSNPNYHNQTVWITGASSGIGQYLAYEFSKCGAYLILSARNFEELNRVKKACSDPQKIEVVRLDMTDYQAVQTVTRQIIGRLEREGKRLDVMVQNAGISMRSLFQAYAFENHLMLFDVNIHGPFKHLQILLPHMMREKSGHIVAISSQSGIISTAFKSSYAGSKEAFIAILDSLRSEVAPFGIRVCNIMPGCIKTNISKNALSAGRGQKFAKTDSNIGQGMQPAQFAKQAVAAIYNKENEVWIAKKWMPLLWIVLRNICPDLVFAMLLKNAKCQQKALLQAKSE